MSSLHVSVPRSARGLAFLKNDFGIRGRWTIQQRCRLLFKMLVEKSHQVISDDLHRALTVELSLEFQRGRQWREQRQQCKIKVLGSSDRQTVTATLEFTT